MAPESKDKVDIRFHHLLTSSYSIPLLSFIASSAPCVGLFYISMQKGGAVIYLVGYGLIAAFYGVLFALALGFLTTEIKKHIANSTMDCGDLTFVLWRLRAAYYAGSLFFTTALTAYLIFGVWDYLLRKSSYIFLVIQIACGPLVTALILSVSRISHVHRSHRSVPVRVTADRTAAAVHPTLPETTLELWPSVRLCLTLFFSSFF